MVSLAGCEFGHSLGAFADGVLGEFTREEKSDGGLDFATAKSALLVVADELAGLKGNALEGVVDEGVHDAHAPLADSGVWVDLLEDTVDVKGEGFRSLLGLLGGTSTVGFGWALSGGFLSGHFNIAIKFFPPFYSEKML